MATWIQSLSWTLIYSLGQGFVVYASLLLVLKLVPALSSALKYRLSLSALVILLVWFAITWWQQFHLLTLANEPLFIFGTPGATSTYNPASAAGAIDRYGRYRSLLSSIEVISPWLSSFYLAGLLLMLVRLSAGMQQLFSLGRNGLSNPGIAFEELLTLLKKRMNFPGSVQLFVSAKAKVPMVVGFFKPVILMPAAVMAQLSMEQLETILMHELAHIKRYDYLVNMLQAVIETILFFNPFVWLVSAIMRREMEHCCDDLVLDHTLEPLSYATALAALATLPGTAPSFAVAASGQPNYLFNRIKRIMEMKKNQFSYSRMVAAILIISAITCSIAWLTPSFSKAKKDETDKLSTLPVTRVQKEAIPAVGKEEKQLPAKTEKPAKVVVRPSVRAQKPKTGQDNVSEETKLVNRLIGDGLVDQVKGFVVERKQDKLYINGQQQTDEIAEKYLPSIRQEYIRVQVFSFQERLNMHPDASFNEILFPVSFSSGCVSYKKPGC